MAWPGAFSRTPLMRTWPASTSAAALVRAFTTRACHNHLSRRWRSKPHHFVETADHIGSTRQTQSHPRHPEEPRSGVSKDDGPAAHPSRLAEPVIGPRFARTRWLAPPATTTQPLRGDDRFEMAEGWAQPSLSRTI